MKRFLRAALTVLLALGAAAEASAAGTVTVTRQDHSSVRSVRLAWTSDASGVVSGTTAYVDGVILRVVYLPGAGGVQPTDLYDALLVDADGLDVLAGKGANLSNANKAQITPFIGDGTVTNNPVAVASTVELTIANAGNAKSGTVILYFR